MSEAVQYGMVIDAANCMGCQTCVISCKLSNQVPGEAYLSHVKSLDGEIVYQATGTFPNAKMAFRPVLCNHCANPVCVRNCPTGATSKNESTGIVSVDQDICIGCETCVKSCPYEIPVLSKEESVAYKCDFCASLIAEGKEPYCVDACPAGVRYIGIVSDPDSEVSKMISAESARQYLPENGTSPSVYYIEK